METNLHDLFDLIRNYTTVIEGILVRMKKGGDLLMCIEMIEHRIRQMEEGLTKLEGGNYDTTED